MSWPWRIGIPVAAAIAVWLSGFVFGRRDVKPGGALSCPPVAQAKSAEAAKVETHAAAAQQIAATASRAKHTHRVRKLALEPGPGPGGKPVKYCEETTDTFTDEHQAAQAAAQQAQATKADVTRQVEIRTVLRAAWKAGLLVGMNAGAVTGSDRRWWLGGSVTHAFIGPLRWGGAVVYRQGQPTDVAIVGEVEF